MMLVYHLIKGWERGAPSDEDEDAGPPRAPPRVGARPSSSRLSEAAERGPSIPSIEVSKHDDSPPAPKRQSRCASPPA
eukprot:CAMPEP_0180146136 /NCGR_PEP_ID=MMETSP0986-20121125/18246_1 /TAXON_ID=697907 /ORGANISM="non described non described, Strain CCMP2293" /LENGTH=77 /DNA_ID=CAMNT_0022090967 /DNA_START=1 /DNA_END=230 /DNA_ORIENTATION=+